MLASRLTPIYRYENCAVVALNNGGVIVGAQIAIELHCPINLLVSSDITLPKENEAFASITSDGSFSYNHNFSKYELDEMQSEYFQLIEQEKMQKLHEMHRLVGSTGTMRKDLLKGRNIILVSDGLKSGHALDMAIAYLKPIATEKIIVATPLASIPAVDYMHVMADDICCLSVIDNYMDTDHYYDQPKLPDEKKIIETIEKIVLQWK